MTYVQRPLSPSEGYRPHGLMERRIAGVGVLGLFPTPPTRLRPQGGRVTQRGVEVVLPGPGIGHATADHVPPMLPPGTQITNRCPPGVRCGAPATAQALVTTPNPARGVVHDHPDTPAYEFGGGWPTPFDDTRDWQGIHIPLAPVSWYYYGSKPTPISRRGRAGGVIGEQKRRYLTARNTPFFAAEMKLRDPTPGRTMPTWPDRRASMLPGGGPAPFFRVWQSTTDDRREKSRWPHLPAVQAGDQVLVANQFLKDRQRVMPSGRFIQARTRYYPRKVIPNPHMYDPNAVEYVRVIKPGLEDPTPGETWVPVSGLGMGRIGQVEPQPSKVDWAKVLMVALSIPPALFAWQQWKRTKPRANRRRFSRRRSR